MFQNIFKVLWYVHKETTRLKLYILKSFRHTDFHSRRNSNFKENFTRSRWWRRRSTICQNFAIVLTSRPFGIHSPCSKLMSMMSSLVHKRTEVAPMKIIQYGHSWVLLLLSFELMVMKVNFGYTRKLDCLFVKKYLWFWFFLAGHLCLRRRFWFWYWIHLLVAQWSNLVEIVQKLEFI